MPRSPSPAGRSRVVETLSSAEVAAVRAAIESERARTELRAAALGDDFDAIVEATAEANTDDEHDPEGATIGFERAQITAMRERAELELGELDAARDRLESGTYGVCANCGDRIATERLLARPATTTCVTCAR
jgi:DnaK suppressor protein